MPLKTTYLDEGPHGWIAGDYDLTRRDAGTVNPRQLLHIRGQKGEERLFESNQGGRYSPDGWGKFVADIKKNGVKSPLSINIYKDGRVVIYEGNHRIRAAIAAGRKTIPVEISYYGNSQRNHVLSLGVKRR